MKYIILSSLFIVNFIFSQDYRDLVRFSQNQVFGSARFEAMGGSFGALGADLSSASINPAGFGRYSSSTAGITFQNTSFKSITTFNNTAKNYDFNAFRLNNLGVVICNDVSEHNNGFIFNQIGFTYNRIANFKNDIFYEGTQYLSLLDEYTSMAQGYSPEEVYAYLPFSSALAWESYAIDRNDEGFYVSRLNENSMIHHKRLVKYSGGISEYNFNLSGNYNNKLYIGGNIGIRTANYYEDTYHYEVPENTEGVNLDSFNYEYHLKIKGSGTNFKFGLIYLPSESFRIGFSVHSPTFFKLKDTYSADMTTFQKDGTYRIDEEFKPKGEYKYLLRTPAKAVFSLAYVFQTLGSINLDVDLVNYDWAHFKNVDDPNYEPYDYTYNNKEAKNFLRPTFNYRIGAEFVVLSRIFLRAGYALFSSAYDQNQLKVKNQQIFSGGLGFKWGKNTLDLAFRYFDWIYDYYAFSASQTNVTTKQIGVSVNYSLSF